MTPLRLALLASLATGAVLAGPSDAGCYGTPTYRACTASREVTRQCVYTGGTTCKWVVVNAPLCIYGNIGSGYFVTTWC